MQNALTRFFWCCEAETWLGWAIPTHGEGTDGLIDRIDYNTPPGKPPLTVVRMVRLHLTNECSTESIGVVVLSVGGPWWNTRSRTRPTPLQALNVHIRFDWGMLQSWLGDLTTDAPLPWCHTPPAVILRDAYRMIAGDDSDNDTASD